MTVPDLLQDGSQAVSFLVLLSVLPIGINVVINKFLSEQFLQNILLVFK